MDLDLKNIPTETLTAELVRRHKLQKSMPKVLQKPDFSKLVKLLEKGIKSIVENEGFPGKDFEGQVFEMALTCTFGEKVWKWWKEHASY
jgi:hypothetical protein